MHSDMNMQRLNRLLVLQILLGTNNENKQYDAESLRNHKMDRSSPLVLVCSCWEGMA